MRGDTLDDSRGALYILPNPNGICSPLIRLVSGGLHRLFSNLQGPPHDYDSFVTGVLDAASVCASWGLMGLNPVDDSPYVMASPCSTNLGLRSFVLDVAMAHSSWPGLIVLFVGRVHDRGDRNPNLIQNTQILGIKPTANKIFNEIPHGILLSLLSQSPNYSSFTSPENDTRKRQQ
ncbi:hypothetical protein Tco_0783692 [Tanacetum coccineum]